MSFIADKQTLEDLNIPGKFKSQSIFSLFNHVKTTGGERLLEKMFQHPLSDVNEINTRSSIFKYFGQNNINFTFNGEAFTLMEDYITSKATGNLLFCSGVVLRKKAMALIARNEQFDLLKNGILASITILKEFNSFLQHFNQDNNNPYREKIAAVKKVFVEKLSWLEWEQPGELPLNKVIRYDYLLRSVLAKEVPLILETIYELDVYVSVSTIAKKNKFFYAHALPPTNNILDIKSFRHPRLEKGITNSLSIHRDNNLLFLTGANMAGKSTIMKSFGIAVYLAHMGFPVAAEAMEFSVKDGIYSSINVSDNLAQGYSHFYAEVLRVKKIAEEVSSGKKLVVIFDELFKGTNVKDAYDATLACTEEFIKYLNCSFIISTHIIEVGEALLESSKIEFGYMPTVMNGHTPQYTYRLARGITNDRQGMLIIQNEGILEMLA